MNVSSHLPTPSSGASAENRRRRGRFRTDLLDCDLGSVRDLSADGMRVFHKGRCRIQVGDYLDLTLVQLDIKAHVHARVVWINPIDKKRREIGFVFTGLTPKDREAIGLLAQVSVACYSHDALAYDPFNQDD